MPAFECEEPADFMHLMMTLRESEASRWTERDTPIFVGKLVEIRVALDALDGVASASTPNAGDNPRRADLRCTGARDARRARAPRRSTR